MKWNIGSKIGGGYALALLALITIGVVAYRSSTGMIDTAALVTHTHQVIETLEQSVSLMKDAETGQRGYIITGEDRYLEPYTTAKSQIDGVMDQLDQLTASDPITQEKLPELKQLIQQKFTELQGTIDLRKDPTKGFDAAKDVILTDKGKDTMDEIRKSASDMQSHERDLLKARSDDAIQSSDQTHATIIWGTLIAVVVLFCVGIWITRDISAPLNRISSVADKIAVGELRVNVPVNDRQDEVGKLARTFSIMIRSLQDKAAVAKQIASFDLRGDVRPQSDRDELGQAFVTMMEGLRKSTGELSEGVNVLAASASEILAATTQVASGAAETGTAIAQTTTTVEEVKQTAQNASQKARAVADSAQKVMQVAQTGRKSVDASIDGMKRIQGQMESIAESVVRLSEQSQAIGEIIATVNDLAEQSNLLAVNAAIEAAKAGEQGKGFGVVAQEVKSLAEQSKQATSQVRAILNEIQKATTAAVLATEQGSKAVEAGVKQSAEAGDSIRQLADGITEAAQAATQIAASSQQQMAGTDQVALAMENIKQASAQNVAGTKQAETAAHNLHELGQKLKQLVDQYKV
ncbi:MAG TPA: CHASE3 domain-containing protein [Chthoniobacteraceae bacterium]|jgi:methyl-accepting chemotaxis protein|nr:CHASE3 domain-containing protein [Chthoniobacteraceae bacterium]